MNFLVIGIILFLFWMMIGNVEMKIRKSNELLTEIKELLEKAELDKQKPKE